VSYYVRAFCTSTEVPSLRTVLEWARGQGCTLEVAPEGAAIDIDSADWDEVPILYKAGRTPFLSSISRDDGTPDRLFREEVREFEESLEDVDDSPAKRRVLGHLRQSRYVVANQLPAADIDEDGYRASAVLLEYFVHHAGGMAQADGEGFYDGETLLVELA
jgi:hypothetical protein